MDKTIKKTIEQLEKEENQLFILIRQAYNAEIYRKKQVEDLSRRIESMDNLTDEQQENLKEFIRGILKGLPNKFVFERILSHLLKEKELVKFFEKNIDVHYP
jgi:hypothetical protein